MIHLHLCNVKHFYPRSPCGERPKKQLLSRLHRYFYPRSPCGERLSIFVFIILQKNISIHALLAESDLTQTELANRAKLFLSTLSLRRATWPTGDQPSTPGISIHALLAESDMGCIPWLRLFLHFYPRSPCGERPVLCFLIF